MSALLGFHHNWSEPLLERVSFLTGVIRAEDGTEQRQKRRRVPRRGLSWQPVVSEAAMGLFHSILFSRLHEPLDVPLWTDGQILTSPLPGGATQIPVQTDACSWEPGGRAVLLADPHTYEVVGIESVGDGVLELADPTQTTWGVGAPIYPLISGGVHAGGLSPQRLNDRAASVPLTLECDHAPALTGAALGTTYQGLDVMELRPNSGADWTETLARDVVELDNPLGTRARDPRTDAIEAVQGFTFELASRPEIWAFRRWLYLRAGRLAPFWMPTHRSDLLLAANTEADSAEIIVHAVGYSDHVDAHPARRDLRMVFADGQALHRRIVSASKLPFNKEVLTLDAPVGVAAAPSRWRKISFLTRARLDHDSVEIAWYNGSTARVQINVRGLLS